MFGGRRAKITANKIAQQKQQQILSKQENQIRHRNLAIDNSLKQTQFRYPQPPLRISPARITPERNFCSDFSRSQVRYNEGTRTLIPTPVPGAPENLAAKAKSTNQQR